MNQFAQKCRNLGFFPRDYRDQGTKEKNCENHKVKYDFGYLLEVNDVGYLLEANAVQILPNRVYHVVTTARRKTPKIDR